MDRRSFLKAFAAAPIVVACPALVHDRWRDVMLPYMESVFEAGFEPVYFNSRVWYVTSEQLADYTCQQCPDSWKPTLAAAQEAAQPGDTIIVMP